MPAGSPDPPAVDVRGVVKRYGRVVALGGIDLSVAVGEVVALLGPSGCGKSTLLACVAGLAEVDGGSISLGGRVVSGPHAGVGGGGGAGAWVAPQDRHVGLVFQDHALFPHLDVAANVAFGLHRLSRAERAARAHAMLELVRLGHVARRYPHELSGGESQRVALARCLAPAPVAVLLDEPFASLDPELRADLRAEVAAVLRQTGVAAILVTHDASDALALADRIVAMRGGVAVQSGAPLELLDCPADEGVARTFGPVTAVRADAPAAAGLGLPQHRTVPWPDGPVVVLRPHEWALAEPAAAAQAQALEGAVVSVTLVGPSWRVVVGVDPALVVNGRAIADVPRRRRPRVGDAVSLLVRLD